MRFYITLVVLMGSVFVFAQKSELRGIVYNKKTGEPVPYANLYLKESMQGTSSDAEGLYVITSVKPGT